MCQGVPVESTADLFVPNLRESVRPGHHPDPPAGLKAPHEVPGVYTLFLLVSSVCV